MLNKGQDWSVALLNLINHKGVDFEHATLYARLSKFLQSQLRMSKLFVFSYSKNLVRNKSKKLVILFAIIGVRKMQWH